MTIDSGHIADRNNDEYAAFLEEMRLIDINFIFQVKELEELLELLENTIASADEQEMLPEIDRVTNLIRRESDDEFDEWSIYDLPVRVEPQDVFIERSRMRAERRRRTAHAVRRQRHAADQQRDRNVVVFCGYYEDKQPALYRYKDLRRKAWKYPSRKGFEDRRVVGETQYIEERQRNSDLESQIRDYDDDRYTDVSDVGTWFSLCNIADREGFTPVFETEYVKFYELTDLMGVYDDADQPWYAEPFWKKAGNKSENDYYDDMMAFHDDPRTMAAELDLEPASFYEPGEERSYQYSSE